MKCAKPSVDIDYVALAWNRNKVHAIIAMQKQLMLYYNN